MEKLIKLLNEYGKTNNCGPFEDCRIEPATDYNSSYLVLQRDDNGEGDWKDWFLDIPRLISKEYGFIQWLVENEKIDIFKSGIDELPRMFSYDYKSVECKSDRLLMVISIQDDPIEFLIDTLK